MARAAWHKLHGKVPARLPWIQMLRNKDRRGMRGGLEKLVGDNRIRGSGKQNSRESKLTSRA